MADRVRITDVSPRDGLQNEQGVIPTEDKARLVAALATAGVDEIEVTSFVSAKRVPQLGDAAEVFAVLRERVRATPLLSALVPNERGLLAALDVNEAAGRRLIGKVAVFTAASETFAQRNTGGTVGETLARFQPVIAGARTAGLVVRGYVSCAVACPFEGPIPPGRVAAVCARLIDLGVDEIDLGDTIGAGTPAAVAALLGAVDAVTPLRGRTLVTLHLHDTFGRAAGCVKTALDLGVRSFDGAVGGLGGCPYAGTPSRRAPGNIGTELLVRTLHAAGYETGVDLNALADVAALAHEVVSRSRAGAPA